MLSLLWLPTVLAQDASSSTEDDGLIIEAERATAEQTVESVDRVVLTEAQSRSADLGQVLSDRGGIVIQRSGGLGASQRLNLDGFSGDQVRVFLDGVPLEYTGLGTTLADVPLDLIEAAEVHHGVVPIRLGADALGGAIALETRAPEVGLHGSASYQGGSWGTHRAAGRVAWMHGPTGVYVEGAGFWDRADNDWPVDVEIADLSGQTAPAKVPRQNGAYQAGGGRLVVGLSGKSWADQVELRLLGSGLEKGLPHNLVMTVPYGEVSYGRSARGATARWRWSRAPLSLSALGAWAWRETRFSDQAEVVYDWYGDVIRDRETPGELGDASELLTWQHSGYARLNADAVLGAHNSLHASMTLQLTRRLGDDLYLGNEPGTRDPYASTQHQRRTVLGASWRSYRFADRLRLEVFGKGYGYAASLAGLVDYIYDERALQMQSWGVGGSGMWQGSGPWYLKASAERALRLPSPDEVFGDGMLIQPNIALEPEYSRNANVELGAHGLKLAAHRLDVSVRGVYRDADNLVVLMSSNIAQQWLNVYSARGSGVQGSAAWGYRERLGLSGQGGWMALRNASEEGTFSAYVGDRIPNRPYLDASGRAWVQSPELRGSMSAGLDVTCRYIHRFYRSWESAGATETKQFIPSQQLWGAGLWLRLQPTERGLTLSAEGQNLLDAPSYDLYGVQRPGRSAYLKLSARW